MSSASTDNLVYSNVGLAMFNGLTHLLLHSAKLCVDSLPSGNRVFVNVHFVPTLSNLVDRIPLIPIKCDLHLALSALADRKANKAAARYAFGARERRVGATRFPALPPRLIYCLFCFSVATACAIVNLACALINSA